MFYIISYKYFSGSKHYADNVVGRQPNGSPIGYGPNGPAGRFAAGELPRVLSTLFVQLRTDDITLTLTPDPE